MTRTSSGFILLLCLSTLTSCTVGPNYHAIAPVTPGQWQAAAQTDLKPLRPEALAHWWQSFNDAELNRLMTHALTNNLDLKIALTRIDQARAERRGTRTQLFPSAKLVAGVQRNDNPFPGFVPGIRYNMFETGFDALWEVDVFGRLQRRLEAAEAETEAASEDYRQAQVMLTAELARTYVECRSLQNQLRITRANLQAQQHTLALTEKLFKEGVSARHDVVRARAQVETTAAQIPSLEANLTAGLRQLDVLLGQRPGAALSKLDESLNVPVSAGRDLLMQPAQILRYRPDLRAAERKLAAATAMQGAAVAEMFPKISLSAFVGLRNTDLDTLFKSAAFSYGTVGNFAQPLLNFGRIQAGIDLTKAQQQQAYFSYEKAVLEALQEVETALSRYLKEEIRRQALSRSVADLQESVRLSQLRYQEGVISFLDVLDAQRAQYAAEIDQARSDAATLTNLIAVYKALGGGANAMQPKYE